MPQGSYAHGPGDVRQGLGGNGGIFAVHFYGGMRNTLHSASRLRHRHLRGDRQGLRMALHGPDRRHDHGRRGQPLGKRNHPLQPFYGLRGWRIVQQHALDQLLFGQPDGPESRQEKNIVQGYFTGRTLFQRAPLLDRKLPRHGFYRRKILLRKCGAARRVLERLRPCHRE